MSNNVLLAMKVAIECNNTGAALLKRGCKDEALEALKVAAQLMYPVSQCVSPPLFLTLPSPYAAYQEIDEMISREKALHYLQSEGTMLDVIHQVQVDLQRIKDRFLSDEKNMQDQNEDTDCFVYTTPIDINTAQAAPTSCTIDSAIIVYNMGLAYHLYAAAGHICLPQALCLFDMAFCLAYPVDSDKRASTIVMASLNNAAQIYHSYGNYTLSQQYLNSLSTYIARLPTPQSDEDVSLRHRFLLNAVMLRKPKVAAAA